MHKFCYLSLIYILYLPKIILSIINFFFFKENLFGTYTDLSVQSIFSEASIQHARDPHTFHIISNAGATSKRI